MDKKKKIIYISILGILLFIGASFAVWILNFTQTNSNILSSACFDITYTDQDNIQLENAYPITDEEGKSLTPYKFTIKNKCSEYASYQVNLEVLDTTTLDSGFVKVMFAEETPKILSSYTEVTKTLNNASSAYKMTIGYLQPNEEKTYTLRFWIDEKVTMEDNISNKTFASKVTIVSTYKNSAPTPLEDCVATYGEGATLCNIIAQADLENDKCLKVDENGMILNPDSSMSDEDEPLICAMEDDYGTSYYFRGNHTTNNVKFANMCWKLVRVTGSGGYKLIYNGDLDANGKCTTTSGNHTGFTGQALTLSGNRVFGSSYTKEGNTYTLTNTSTLNWANDSSSIIGQYTCGNTNTSCTTLYAVVAEYSSTQGYALKLNQSTNYAQVGTSFYHHLYGAASYAGYMYNDVYPYQLKTMTTSTTFLSALQSNTSNFYYGDSISYSGGYYYISNQDGSNVVQLSWASNYESNLVGKYTCRGTSKYNDTSIRCKTAYKVLDTTSTENFMISESLSGGRLAVGTIQLSNGYTDNGDGTYTLNGPVIEKSPLEWYSQYSNYNNYYVCGDYNQRTCNNLYKIISVSNVSFGTEVGVFNNYYYGNSFTYENGVYTLTGAEQFWDISDSDYKNFLDTHHYTCFKTSDNTCTEMYYIYFFENGIKLYYIQVNGNESGFDAVSKMVIHNDINVKNSHIKGSIDWWYETHLKNTEYESYLEDTVFCSDRTISSMGGWTDTGSVSDVLAFNGKDHKYYLKCPSKRDAFTVSDETYGNSALTYPVGLLTTAESALLGNKTVQATGSRYWNLTPHYYNHVYVDAKYIKEDGSWGSNDWARGNFGVRPAISLKPGTTFKDETDGTASNPYEIE